MTLLIVDDSKFSQSIISNLLGKHLENANFIFASDGHEGYEKYRENHPDYIFTDLLMPTMNGTEMVRLIKEDDKNARIIVLSADVQKSIKEEMERYGIVSFINKPLNEEKAGLICEMIKDESK